MEICMERFNSNLNKKGYHRLPDKLDHYPVDTAGYNLSQGDHKSNIPLRVGLIGFPPFFGTIIKKLKKEGHHVEQFFLPYHPNRHINRFLKFRLPVKLLSLFAGNFYSYRTLNFDYKDERIGQVLREGNFDIGFHKLNFIIKENIFGAFRKGLLNDHWGYLPLLRGKSTIAYSLLLNVPVISTVHFINGGIDSGPIAGYYACDYSKAKNVKEIRRILRKKMPERAIAAIKYAGGSLIPKENISEAGVTFYEIHPWLNEHIASRILKQ
jgi:methionyl-tRNA formyltransferase